VSTRSGRANLASSSRSSTKPLHFTKLISRSTRSADPLLSAVEEARRTTLVAVPDAHGFRFDIRLQGEGETVFLTYPRH